MTAFFIIFKGLSLKHTTQIFLKGESPTLIRGSFDSKKENSEKAFINAVETILRKLAP